MSAVQIKNWSTEKILKLIELYKQEPMLWDPSHKDFKNSDLKSTVWVNIAEIIGSRDAEKKMNILIVQFRREMKKIRERLQAGKSAEEAATKWFAFEAMSFLKGKIRKQKHGVNPINSTLVSLSELNSSLDRQNELRSGKWKLNVHNHSTSIENVEYDQTIFSKNGLDIKDEYSAFGEMVAIKLRKLSSSYAKNKAMNLITNSLFQVEVESGEGECEETEMVYVKTLDDDR